MWRNSALSSLQKTATGYRIQFRIDGHPQSVSLGKLRKPDAETVQIHINRLIQIQRGVASPTTADLEWIARQSPAMTRRLVATGLLSDRKDDASSFVEAIDNYTSTMRTWSASTVTAWKTHRQRVFLYFANRPFRLITVGDARDFKQFLLAEPIALSENSARKTTSCCAQVFKWLIDHERATRNPFKGLPTTISKAVKREYVSAETVCRVIDYCPTSEWKSMFALARFAGLRCPSESFLAKWSSVDWERGTMLIESPKKKDTRLIPLFPALRHYLSQHWNELPPGASDWILPTLRETSGSLHAPAAKIIVRSKQLIWPRLFHNMRSSCETDLTDRHGLAHACHWLGNSTTIAAKHYIQTTEKHRREASAGTFTPPSAPTFAE